MSIFEKDCPQCASANPTHAVSCRCGYSFDPEAGEANQAQEERLYRDYLAARLVQAEAALKVARAEVAADPDNQMKVAQALLAEQALNAARAELRALAPRTHRPHATFRTPHAAPKTIAVPTNKLVGTRPVAAGATLVRPPVKLASAKTVAPRAALPSAPKPAVQTEPVAPVVSAKPGPVFRAVQTVKAEAAVRAKKVLNRIAPKAGTPFPAPGTHAPKSGTRIPVKAAAPTAKKSASLPGKECPHCTALVPLDATRCRCGFSLPTVTVEMPSVALDAETLALLAQGLNVGSRR